MNLTSKFRSFGFSLQAMALGLAVLAAPATRGSTVWDGPLFTYNQPSSDPTLATNQDRLTSKVWLTRAASKGLFNAVTETNATQNSPADTRWAFGALTNYLGLTYQTWGNLLNGASPITLVDKPLVVHLLSNNIYLSIQFTFWGSHADGGFTYQRSTPPVPPALSAGSTTNSQFSFTYTSTPGGSYVVQRSSNLLTWVPAVTNVASSNVIVFSESFISNQNRLYRVGRLTNP